MLNKGRFATAPSANVSSPSSTKPSSVSVKSLLRHRPGQTSGGLAPAGPPGQARRLVCPGIRLARCNALAVPPLIITLLLSDTILPGSIVMLPSHRKSPCPCSPLATFVLAGCVPTTWLPDSSGFIYVKPRRKARRIVDPPTSVALMQYDLQKKTSRQIVEDIGTPRLAWRSARWQTCRGRQVTGGPKEAKTAQIVDLRYAGQATQANQGVRLDAGQRAVFIGGPRACCFGRPRTTTWSSPIHQQRHLPTSKPTRSRCWKIGPSTAWRLADRPDGKGFLAVIDEGTTDKAKAKVVFMDWTGAEQRIDVTAFAKAIAQGPRQEG